jgi:hypothetical protein
MYPIRVRDGIDPVLKKIEKILAERADRYILMLR